MEGLILWLQGFALGLAIAAPVGPIGLLCIRRTLEHGPLAGFATGMGAAVADTIFGAVAAFGMTAVLAFLSGQETFFRFFGSIFLFVIAYRTYHARPHPPESDPSNARSCWSGFLVGLGLTLTNPITVLACLALFAGLGIGATLNKLEASTLVLGVFCGSAAWWLALSSGVALVRHRISENRFVLINRYTAIALAAFGVWTFATAIQAIAFQYAYI